LLCDAAQGVAKTKSRPRAASKAQRAQSAGSGGAVFEDFDDVMKVIQDKENQGANVPGQERST